MSRDGVPTRDGSPDFSGGDIGERLTHEEEQAVYHDGDLPVRRVTPAGPIMLNGGLWGMGCFDGLDDEQKRRLVYHGNLIMGDPPRGECKNMAQLEVTTIWDEMPGPRFYCVQCAIKYLEGIADHVIG